MPAIQYLDSAHSLDDLIGHALARQPHLTGRRIRYELRGEDVVLTGSVRTYFEKQMAQESLRRIQGLGRIVNDVEVVSR